MINLTEAQRSFICKNIENGERLIGNGDIEEVLKELDYLMMLEGFDENDEPNERGWEIERIRDEIYENN